jgi:protein-tyrosine phosphatase
LDDNRAVIDLHCHMLPGIDDGAPDEATSLEMARIAVADGITTTACTPHIYPGLYENDAAGIKVGIVKLQRRLFDEGIALKLTIGADAHLTPELLGRLRAGTAPSLAGGRYFLLEPPHTIAPPRFAESMFDFVAAGYTPVLTHPERLSWIKQHYAVFVALVKSGVWMQVTAGSLNGRFGEAAKHFGEKMLDDGLVHLLATDAHSTRHRPPLLAEGRRAAEKFVGAEEAARLVFDRPQAILDNRPPKEVAPVPAMRDDGVATTRRGFLARVMGRGRR